MLRRYVPHSEIEVRKLCLLYDWKAGLNIQTKRTITRTFLKLAFGQGKLTKTHSSMVISYHKADLIKI